MDSSSSSHQNWLGFSLSNNHYSPDSSNLSLFEAAAFNSTANNHHPPCEEDDTPNDGPKLEDFLGGRCTDSSDICHFTTIAADAEIYGSELTTITAGFLHGFSPDQNDPSQKQLVVVAPPGPPAKKAVDTFGQRTSIYRGVTRHRWTGRYEAHLWDNSCRREGQSRKGRQVYLGGYDKEDKAARAYDLAALKYWGPTTTTNFPVSNYEKELEEMNNMTRQEFVASLRRKSSGFSRGASIYRGVTRHHQHGRWQARIGRVAGNKDLYLGTFSTQEEAAEAYDIAAIKFRGLNAVTNFDMTRYDVKSIVSSNLPIGGKSKPSSDTMTASDSKSITDTNHQTDDHQDLSVSSSTLSFALPIKQNTGTTTTADYWSVLGYNTKHPSTSAGGGGATTTLFQASTSCTPLAYQGDISNSNDDSINNGYCSNNGGGGGGGGGGGDYYHQQQNMMTSTSTNDAALDGGNRNCGGSIGGGVVNDENGSSFGNWVGPSIHSFESAKPNLSSVVLFQTPIFGIE